MKFIDVDALLKQIDEDAKKIGPGQYGDEWRFIETIRRMPILLGAKCEYCGSWHPSEFDRNGVPIKGLCEWSEELTNRNGFCWFGEEEYH